MKKLLFIFILTNLTLFALPIKVQKDQYFNALEKAIDDKDYEKAKRFVPKLDALIKENDIKLNSAYYYFKAKSAYENAQYSDVYNAAEQYVKITNRSGKYYKKILKVLNDTDDALLDDEEINRQRELEIFILRAYTFQDSKSNGSDESVLLNWDEAKEYCEELEHANFTDWTLPTKHQLVLLQKEKKNLQYVLDSSYWSRTTNEKESSIAWSVDFNLGSISNTDKFDNYFLVRCVR